jgi:hypothetical protein
MGAPFEVVAGPIQAWVAPLSTAFPLVDIAPAASWILLGVNGDKNITEDGMTVRQAAEVNIFRSLGQSMGVKAFRVSEDVEVEFDLADMTLEAIDKASGGPATAAGNVISTAASAGVAGFKSLSMVKGFVIPTVALLVRSGINPYGDGFNIQWQFPKAVIPGDGIEFIFIKDDVVKVHYRAICLYDANMKAVFQHQAPA